MRVIALPDVHIPYHDQRSWNIALEVVDYLKPKHVIQLGDLADNRPFSRHKPKYGERRDPEHDMAVVRDEVAKLEAVSRGKLTCLAGNHDYWYYNYVAEQAPALSKSILTLGQAYGLKREPVPYHEILKIGKVGYVHDLGHAGKTALRQTLEAAGHCIVFGHTHRAGVEYTGDAHGRRWFSMSCGWLGDASKINYMPQAKTREWQTGFGDIYYDSGIAYARFIPIIDGRCQVDGKRFK